MIISSKKLILTCILGLVMALASKGYAQTEGDPSPVVMMDAGAEVASEAAPAPVAAAIVEAAPAEEAVAPAPEAQETALSKLSAEVLSILIPAFLALIGLLVTWVLNKIRKVLHLNVTDKQIAAWAALADKAANRGAEWARNKARDLTEGETIPGPEVLEVAVDWAIEMGRAFNLPEMGREKLVGLIESHLHAKREDSANPLPLELPKATVVSDS